MSQVSIPVRARVIGDCSVIDVRGDAVLLPGSSADSVKPDHLLMTVFHGTVSRP